MLGVEPLLAQVDIQEHHSVADKINYLIIKLCHFLLILVPDTC
jgi:hypothetical protein